MQNSNKKKLKFYLRGGQKRIPILVLRGYMVSVDCPNCTNHLFTFDEMYVPDAKMKDKALRYMCNNCYWGFDYRVPEKYRTIMDGDSTFVGDVYDKEGTELREAIRRRKKI